MVLLLLQMSCVRSSRALQRGGEDGDPAPPRPRKLELDYGLQCTAERRRPPPSRRLGPEDCAE